MADADKGEVQGNLLALPYRDRQLVAVMPKRESESTIEQQEIPLSAYFVGNSLNPLSVFTKDYWVDVPKRMNPLDSKNWGLYGYAFDKVRNALDISKGSIEKSSVRNLLKVPANLAERDLHFPPGHPLYNTVYVGHPLKTDVYTPLANFHHFLFEEKFNELLKLLWSLSATKVTINYIRGYRNAFDGSVGLSIPTEIPVKVGTSFERKVSNRSEATLEAFFNPVGNPRIPESTAWYAYEPTWQKIAEARLTAGLQAIDVELRYDDDFGVNGEIAATLLETGFKIGGDFQKHERTSWKFHSSFT